VKLLIVFLAAMFVLGGSRGRTRELPRPLFLLCTCVVVGAMFYSRRII
jgi:hypothetical protein